MTRQFSPEDIETMISGWLLGTREDGTQTLFYNVEEDIFAQMTFTSTGLPILSLVEVTSFTSVTPLEPEHLSEITPQAPTLETLYTLAECLESFFGPGAAFDDDDLFKKAQETPLTDGTNNVLLFGKRSKKTARA